ncbi:MAG: SRPBCC family protein [Hyphomicrobiaceae bacterium]
MALRFLSSMSFWIVLWLSLTVCAEARIPLSEFQNAELMAGNVVVDISTEQRNGEVVIRPIAGISVSTKTVWRTILDCKGAEVFLRHLESCKIIERGKNGRWDLRAHTVRWQWFLPRLQCVIRSDYIAHRQIKFERVSGDLQSIAGQRALHPIRNGRVTRLIHEARIVTGFLVPGGLIRTILKQDIIETLRSLRREAARRHARRRK